MKVLQQTNAVPRQLFNRIKNTIESDSFPWYYAATTAYTDKDNQFEDPYSGSFGHIIAHNDPFGGYLESALLAGLDKMNIEFNKTHRIRIGFLPISPVKRINTPHVDRVTPHKVALMYLNNSDGDTVIYKEKFDVKHTFHGDYRDSINYYEKHLKDITVDEMITPEENKMIVFDGLTYHSSSMPFNTKRRITVNYVFT